MTDAPESSSLKNTDPTLKRREPFRKNSWSDEGLICLQKAKKFIGFGFWDYESGGARFRDAAKYFCNDNLWDLAASAYIMAAKSYVIMREDEQTFRCFVDAAWCYSKIDVDESISCLEQALSICLKNGDDYMIAWCYKTMADTYERIQKTEQAMVYYDRAANLFQNRSVDYAAICADLATICYLKVAKLAALLEQYKKAVEIFTRMGYEETKVQSYGFKEHLLDAGICVLCESKGETSIMRNALKEYQDINPSFRETSEFRLLSDLVDAIDGQDLSRFVDAEMQFSIATLKLDSWRATLLSRAQQAIK